MKWVTRSHVHVDRVACPWLIRRFVDSAAELASVLASLDKAVASEPRPGVDRFERRNELQGLLTRLEELL